MPLWEAIRVDYLDKRELPSKTPGGNSSEKRLTTLIWEAIRVSPIKHAVSINNIYCILNEQVIINIFFLLIL